MFEERDFNKDGRFDPFKPAHQLKALRSHKEKSASHTALGLDASPRAQLEKVVAAATKKAEHEAQHGPVKILWKDGKPVA
jgi:hypothetical protein